MAETTNPAAQAEQTLNWHLFAAAGVGVLPLPWVNLGVLAAVQLNLLRSLAEIYGVEFSSQLGKSAIGALVGSDLSASLAAGLAKSLPGPVWAVGAASGALLGAASTYALGKVFIQHFESGNTFLTFDPAKVKAYYAEQYEQGKEAVRKNFAGFKP
ncbi:MAG: YcjF family protein [Candidatus Methylumidiphilus sp.]